MVGAPFLAPKWQTRICHQIFDYDVDRYCSKFIVVTLQKSTMLEVTELCSSKEPSDDQVVSDFYV